MSSLFLVGEPSGGFLTKSDPDDLVQLPAGAGLYSEVFIIVGIWHQNHDAVRMSGLFDFLPVKGNQLIAGLHLLSLLDKAGKTVALH